MLVNGLIRWGNPIWQVTSRIEASFLRVLERLVGAYMTGWTIPKGRPCSWFLDLIVNL